MPLRLSLIPGRMTLSNSHLYFISLAVVSLKLGGVPTLNTFTLPRLLIPVNKCTWLAHGLSSLMDTFEDSLTANGCWSSLLNALYPISFYQYCRRMLKIFSVEKSFLTGGAVFATARSSLSPLYKPTVVINVVGLPVKLDEIDP